MKAKKTVVVKQCDICKKEAFDTCLCCGKDFCISHAKTMGVTYNHSVVFGGSADGYFCKECDIELTNDSSHPLYRLHEAYKEIAHLQNEARVWNKKFDERSNEAEEHLRYWAKETKKITKD